MSKMSDEILDDCLSRLAVGEAVDDCINRYPEEMDILGPLLRTSVATMQAASFVLYNPTSKARGLDRLMGAVAKRQMVQPARINWLNWSPWFTRPMVAGLVAVLLTVGMAAGTGIASSESVPGEPLYWVKTTRESVSLMVPRSGIGKAKILISMARNRGDEMQRLMARGQYKEVELLEKRMRQHLNESTEFVGVLTPPNPVDMPRLRTMTGNVQGVAELKSILRRDRRDLRKNLRDQYSRLPYGERSRDLDLLRRRAEMGYWSFIASLTERKNQTWRPLWKTEHLPPRDK